MRFMVVGAGSIGSVVGGFLHLGGHDVHLVGKGPHIEAVMDGGLRIRGIWGEHSIDDARASRSVADALASGFAPEWALLSVKSYDTVAALADLAPAFPDLHGIVSLQNGLGNVEAIGAAAPGLAVGGRVIFGATTVEPGLVEVTVCADDVLLGPAPGGPEGVEQVVNAFSESYIPCRCEERILSYIWDKVLYNVCLNALATLLRTDYGSLGDDSNTWSVMETLVDEFYEVAAARGVEPVSPTPADYLARFREDLLPPTRLHRSSMQEDIEQGRRTEIDALNGAVWRMGSEAGIPTPANELLTRMIHFLESR
ncbi:MAG: ketopantoate reductase family protein [Actinobacteria bacterium]|nr:ketopantoate reductase family protein [Actinomycetota bacterium]MBU1942756.1 ketopantoate reductase family protein [Actinomycetota bacterium]MBU2686078.1 ketopantoate reductase family protein [Actinomycetota bacterium]